MELIKGNNIKKMNSAEIALYLEKEHKNVLAVCRKFMKDNDLQSAEFSAEYTDSKNRKQDCFEFNKDYSIAIVALIDNSKLMTIIKRWQELESREQAIFNDPIIAMRQEQLRVIENQRQMNLRIDKIEERAIAISGERELKKEKAPKGFANKGKLSELVPALTNSTKSIVGKVVDYYSDEIETTVYQVEVVNEAGIVITDPVKAYKTSDVIKCVRHALDNSVEKTKCFSIFTTLGNKTLKVNAGE